MANRHRTKDEGIFFLILLLFFFFRILRQVIFLRSRPLVCHDRPCTAEQEMTGRRGVCETKRERDEKTAHIFRIWGGPVSGNAAKRFRVRTVTSTRSYRTNTTTAVSPTKVIRRIKVFRTSSILIQLLNINKYISLT